MASIGRALDGLKTRSDGAAPLRVDAAEQRLWRELASPLKREEPAKGFDLFGERVRGAVARRGVRRVDIDRAMRIVERAKGLRDLSEPAWAEEVTAARELTAVARDDAATIDRVYALAHEAVRRETGLSLYAEQVLGALVMAEGCVAEMATGEGKTLTGVLPAALEGFTGRGVHVVTVNDYLSRRDASITGPSLARLGLSVGVIQEKSNNDERRRAYSCAITYGNDKQFIFDYLRDRLISPLTPRLARYLLDALSPGGEPAGPQDGVRGDWAVRVVQRGLNAAIVDEADSVLIDEAITPAIIGQGSRGDDESEDEESARHYRIAAKIAAQMTPQEHYFSDRRVRVVRLSEAGKQFLAERAATLPAFWAGPRRREELVIQALNAREMYLLGEDYIIRENKIVIVDRQTGRILDGRQWQLGVHQAVEAKEELAITSERRTTARSSYQRFFQRYRRLCGMTGTAWETADELWRYYRLPVARIPTHKPVKRTHGRDRVSMNESAKFQAVADRVRELFATGRPVLVGTRSVTSSERLGALLLERGIPCRILNATREAEEAAIVAQAGQRGAVTVATNMAGRGTDIALGPGVRELGGLTVIATERHDEARVDRQLFGRSGRQGDPGHAECFVSLDDSLVARHGLAPLVWLCRAMRGARPASWVLWSLAQWRAGRRAAMLRHESVKADAWMEMAIHSVTR